MFSTSKLLYVTRFTQLFPDGIIANHFKWSKYDFTIQLVYFVLFVYIFLLEFAILASSDTNNSTASNSTNESALPTTVCFKFTI